ncbi:MAG TPA: chromosomal replication initiator protein DnaA [Candidatus Paceibacterota bacterium]|nr:chromosomal replication initiator protein DnaA [Candidatus Paceibacterota bacterium]
MNDTKKLWGGVLGEVELQISRANFATWFRDTFILKINDGVVYVGVPNIFVKDWLASKYHKLILKGLRDREAEVRAIEYHVSKKALKESEHTPGEGIAVNTIGMLPLHEHYINKEDNLNPKYTFDTFVVGPFNDLAYAAAQAVIKKPGIAYNPLFIYGGTGRGKTHLIQSIGNYIKKTSPSKKVYYLTSERFVGDYLNSLTSGKAHQFKEKYRQYDVLIMDDIQFFSSKEKSQEEFFHLFNALHENNKQLIFSSDKHADHLPDIEERMRSRFKAGMIIDIPAPDLESRTVILRAKAKNQNLNLSDDIIAYLASNIGDNIRELEGIINLVAIQTSARSSTPNLMEIKELVKNNTKPKKNTPIKDIVHIVSEFYNINENSIYEKTRKKEVVKPRQIIMYLLREDMGISYPSIGEKLGGRDHTTVIHSCEKVKGEIKTDQSLLQEINQLRSLIR